MFGSDRLPLAEAYAALLATEGVVRGLIGPREAPRLWDRHLLNCAVLGEAIPADVSVCDIGSGAGLPGLVLAIARPDLRITLVEPLLRRTTFLEEVVDQLGLSGVTVLRGRAEEVKERHGFDVVTSRAVAPLERLLRWSMPLVAPHGALVAMKGSSVAEEIEVGSADPPQAEVCRARGPDPGTGVTGPQHARPAGGLGRPVTGRFARLTLATRITASSTLNPG